MFHVIHTLSFNRLPPTQDVFSQSFVSICKGPVESVSETYRLTIVQDEAVDLRTSKSWPVMEQQSRVSICGEASEDISQGRTICKAEMWGHVCKCACKIDCKHLSMHTINFAYARVV